MIVKVLRNTSGLQGLSYYYVGDVADVDEAVAKRMLELGFAEPFTLPNPRPAKAPSKAQPKRRAVTRKKA